MDISLLHAFVKVAENKSFSEAALELYITQSAVSKRIANLEQQLHCTLFDRIGRQLFLTEAGHQLLPKAKQIILSLQDAKTLVSNLSENVEGQLSFAASHHISLHRLPHLLKQYSKQFPEVNLDLRFEASEAAHEAVIRGDIELALITLAEKQHPCLCSIEIWQDRLHFVCATDHPLAQYSQLTLPQLQNFPAILPRPDTFTHQLIKHQWATHDLQPKLGMSTNSLDTIRMMVTIGLGWSVLPESMLNSELCTLNLAIPPIKRSLGIIYHRDRTLTNAAARFIDLLKTA